MTYIPESDILIAVVGLVGVIGSAVILTYAFSANRKEEVKLRRINKTRAFDQDLLD